MDQFIPNNIKLVNQVNKVIKNNNNSMEFSDDLAAIANNKLMQNQNIENLFDSASQIKQSPEKIGTQDHYDSMFSPIDNMNIQDCVDEYMALTEHLKKLRAETRMYNKRNKELEKKMEDFLKNRKNKKLNIDKKITLSYEVKTQQVPLTKKNILATLEKHLPDKALVQQIFEILTEKRDTIEKRKLKKKKYKE
jgi:hypothetical protein